MLVYPKLLEDKQKGKKSLAVLIDPDKAAPGHLGQVIRRSIEAGVDYFFVGGSLLVSDKLGACIRHIKERCDVPVVLFPGSPTQIDGRADALLYLSLISGRNPELLIGQHVLSAPAVKRSGLEVLSTGYMVIDGGAPTTVSYISNALPIPADKPDIALCTALAGEMLGMKLIYMDAGSGAQNPVSEEMIGTVSEQISVPLIVGGGIRNAEKAYRNCMAGADVIVVGNSIESQPAIIEEIATVVRQCYEV